MLVGLRLTYMVQHVAIFVWWHVLVCLGAVGDTFDCLKAHLAAKDYTQIFCLDYGDIFSLVTNMTSL